MHPILRQAQDGPRGTAALRRAARFAVRHFVKRGFEFFLLPRVPACVQASRVHAPHAGIPAERRDLRKPLGCRMNAGKYKSKGVLNE